MVSVLQSLPLTISYKHTYTGSTGDVENQGSNTVIVRQWSEQQWRLYLNDPREGVAYEGVAYEGVAYLRKLSFFSSQSSESLFCAFSVMFC